MFVRLVSNAHTQDTAPAARQPRTASPRRAGAPAVQLAARTRRYLVCYDTPSDVRRREFARLLSAWGVRVQWSVFECVVNGQELLRLSRALDRLIDTRADDVRIFQCGATGQPAHSRLARYADQPSDYWVS